MTKSTSTENIGIGLARLGKKVLLIDADGQGSLTASLTVYSKGVTAGDDTVTVTSSANPEKSASCNVTVNKKAGTISYTTTSVSKTNGDAAFTNALTNSGDGTVAYASDNTNVAIVNATTGEVTIQSYGEANITATVTDGDNYTYATKTASYKLTVAKRSYEVKFDANGYGTAPASQNVEEDGKATKPADLSSTDYDFTGWYKESACTNKWNFDTDTVTEATTIFAGWKIKTFTVPTTETPTTEAPTTKVDTPTTEAPKADTPKAPTTGDKINLGVIVMLMIDSALAGLYLILRRRLMK